MSMGTHSIEAIVAGGSVGALDALSTIVTALPVGFSIPVAVVVHVPPDRRSYLSEVLAARTAVAVKEAEAKEPLAAGTIYLAPPNYHLLIEKKRCFSLSVDEPVHYSRPSIDVLFESAAWAYGPALAGILLTGANEDGARGMASIRDAGGTTIVQTPASAVVSTMPQAALSLGPADHVLSPAEIGALLARLGRSLVTHTEVL
jgi:two-component system chemotaxis response regulator CheB